MILVDITLMFVIVIAASFSVYYSFKARSYYRNQQPLEMNFYKSKMNICLGIMLLTMAIIQLFTFAETTGWRIVVGLAFLALGSFNLIMGVRNYRLISTDISKKYEQ